MSEDLILTNLPTTVADALLNRGGDGGGQPGKDEWIATIYIPVPSGDDDLDNMDDESGLEQLPPGTYAAKVVKKKSRWVVVRESDPQNAPVDDRKNCRGTNQISITAASGVMGVTVYNGPNKRASMENVTSSDSARTTLYYRGCFTHYVVTGHSDTKHTAAGAIDGHSFSWG